MEIDFKKSSKDFHSILEKLFYLVTEYGIERVKPTEENFSEFQKSVHDGWKTAQNIAVEEILEIQDEIVDKKRIIKDLNRTHNSIDAKRMNGIVECLELRRLKIQYAINAVVWTIFGLQHHILRRFFLRHNINNIENKSLRNTLLYVDEQNQDQNKLCICCDLTTFMHVGDVVLVDNNEVTIVELKEGKVNRKCMDVLQQFNKTQCPRNLFYSTRDFDKSEMDQLMRMVRQKVRASQVLSVLSTGKGVDISTEGNIAIPEEEFSIDSYDDSILEMYQELSPEKSWSIRVIDDCLFIGLYKNHLLAEGAFSVWMKGLDVDSPIYDYRSVFKMPVARPPFTLQFPPELIMGLVTGEIILKLCLHVPFWIQKLNTQYKEVEMVLETAKNLQKMQQGGHMFKYKKQTALNLS